MWKDHYSEILNSVRNTESKELVLQQFSVVNNDFECFSVPEVSKSITELSSGRSCGNDRLSAEHFKFAGVSCATHLSLCFSMMTKHSYAPHSFPKIVLTHIVKDQN